MGDKLIEGRGWGVKLSSGSGRKLQEYTPYYRNIRSKTDIVNNKQQRKTWSSLPLCDPGSEQKQVNAMEKQFSVCLMHSIPGLIGTRGRKC